MPEPLPNWPLVKPKPAQRRRWATFVVALGAIVLVGALAAWAIALDQSKPNYIDTDEEWLQYVDGTPANAFAAAEADTEFCNDLRRLANGEEPKLKVWLRGAPSQDTARLLLPEFCADGPTPESPPIVVPLD